MGKKVGVTTATILVTMIGFWIYFYMATPVRGGAPPPAAVDAVSNNRVAAERMATAGPTLTTCAQPTTTTVEACQAQEAAILATTVRLALQTWSLTNGEAGYDVDKAYAHATIKEERFLVTHNHFGLPLTGNADVDPYIVVFVYTAAGDLIYQAPLTDFALVLVASETVVFDVGAAGAAALAAAGLRSAQFLSGSDLRLQAGMEVAQLDWDGAVAHVDWVQVTGVSTTAGTPHLELDNYVRVGASGGAIFWNGYHVANNWARIADYNAAGAVVNAYSIGALNPHAVAESMVGGNLALAPLTELAAA